MLVRDSASHIAPEMFFLHNYFPFITFASFLGLLVMPFDCQKSSSWPGGIHVHKSTACPMAKAICSELLPALQTESCVVI